MSMYFSFFSENAENTILTTNRHGFRVARNWGIELTPFQNISPSSSSRDVKPLNKLWFIAIIV